MTIPPSTSTNHQTTSSGNTLITTGGNVFPTTAMLTLATTQNNQNVNVISAPIVVDFSNFTVNCVIDNINRDS